MRRFFVHCPALYIGLLLLLGIAMHVAWHPMYVGLFYFILCSYAQNDSKVGFWWRWFCNPFSSFTSKRALVLFFLAYGITVLRLPHVDISQGKMEGSGRFVMTNVKSTRGAFQRLTIYEGTLRDFTSVSGEKLPSLSCSILSTSHSYPADRDYIIEGVLSQNRPWQYMLRPKQRVSWQTVPETFRFAEWRYRAKHALDSFIKKRIHDKNAAKYLSALLTGNVEERALTIELNRLGLSHLLAISGFHFALIAFFLDALLRLLLPFKSRLLFCFLLLSCYFFFLGTAPSILRAYIAISLYFLGKLFGKRISGCNALGVGLCVECLIEPLVITRLSFQLSFLCTLAILLLYRPIYAFLTRIFPERSSSAIADMPLLHQHGYILLSLLRKSLALNFSVHLLSVPVLLYFFHKFPIASLSYNLFIPFLTGIACICLLLALLSTPLPFLHYGFFWASEFVTKCILTLITHAPISLQWTLRTQSFSFSLTLIVLSLLLFFGIRQWSVQNKE